MNNEDQIAKLKKQLARKDAEIEKYKTRLTKLAFQLDVVIELIDILINKENEKTDTNEL